MPDAKPFPGERMDQTQEFVAMLVAAVVGMLATLAILRRQRHESEPPRESSFAASSEGEKRCPQCGMGNLSTGDHCVSCGAKLPDSTT